MDNTDKGSALIKLLEGYFSSVHCSFLLSKVGSMRVGFYFKQD